MQCEKDFDHLQTDLEEIVEYSLGEDEEVETICISCEDLEEICKAFPDMKKLLEDFSATEVVKETIDFHELEAHQRGVHKSIFQPYRT